MKDNDTKQPIEVLLWSGLSKLFEELEKANQLLDCSEHAQKLFVERFPKLTESLSRQNSVTDIEGAYKILKQAWNRWVKYDLHNRITADHLRAREAGCRKPRQIIVNKEESETMLPGGTVSKEIYQEMNPILYGRRSEEEIIEDELWGKRYENAYASMMEVFGIIRGNKNQGEIYYHILWFWVEKVEPQWKLKKRISKLSESLQKISPGITRKKTREKKCKAMKMARDLLNNNADALHLFLYHKKKKVEDAKKYESDRVIIKRYRDEEVEPGPVVIVDATMADSIHSNRPVYNTATGAISQGLPNSVVKEVITYAESKNRQSEMRKLRQQKKKAGLDEQVSKAITDTPKSSRKRGPRTGIKKPTMGKVSRTSAKPSADDAA